MSDPFIGEITAFGFDWAPRGFALCNGAMLSVPQNQALFSLLGTTFGGDGRTTFGIPDLRGRTPIGIGQHQTYNYRQGNTGGAEAVTLDVLTVPPHRHALQAATNDGNAGPPTGNIISTTVPGVTPSSHDFSSYLNTGWTADTPLNAGSVVTAGGNAAHNNMQPFSVVNFCIAMMGLYPTRG